MLSSNESLGDFHLQAMFDAMSNRKPNLNFLQFFLGRNEWFGTHISSLLVKFKFTAYNHIPTYFHI
jgi:hypothetical protein